MKHDWVVYALTDDSGTVRYIGKTANAKSRLTAHVTVAKRTNATTHSSNWIRSLLRRGIRPQMIIVEKCDSESHCFSREIAWIKHFRDQGNDLCNRSSGGDGPRGCTATMETRLLMSMARKGKKRPPFTEEHKRAISLGRKGISCPHSELSRWRISRANKGKVRTTEMRLRLGERTSKLSKEQDAEIFQDKTNLTMIQVGKKWGFSPGCVQKALRRHKMRLQLHQI